MHQCPEEISSVFSSSLLLQLSWDLLGTLSQDDYLQPLNSAWSEVLGWSQPALISIPWLEQIHPDDLTATQQQLRSLRQFEREHVTFQNRMRHQEGHYCNLSWKATITIGGLIYVSAKEVVDTQTIAQWQQQKRALEQTIESLRATQLQQRQELDEQIQALELVTQELNQEWIQRQQLEAALANTNNRIENLSANLPGAIFQFSAIDATWRIDYISEGVWDIMGVKPADVIKDLSALIARVHPEDVRRCVASIAEAIANSCSWHFEGRLIKPSGQERWWQSDASPIQQPNGEVTFYGVLLDITERKQTEAELKQAKLHLEGVVATRTQELRQVIEQLEHDKRDRDRVLQAREQAEQQLQRSLKELADIKLALDRSSIVGITNANGIITAVNDNFCQISGYTRAELLGQTYEIIRSRHQQEFFQEMWNTISSGRIWQGEIENYAKDGSLFWVSSTVVPMLDDAGVPYQYISIRHDITERKQASARLQEREQFLRNIYEGVSYEIFVVDVTPEQEFRLVGLNPFAEQVMGMREVDIAGKLMQEVFGEAEGAAVIQRYRQCVEAGHTIVYEECLTLKNQSTWWLTTLNPLRDQAGRIHQLVGTAFDISDRIRAEQALRESKQLLQLVFDTLPQRVFWKDKSHRYLGCNKLFAQDAGFTLPEELIGKTDFDLIWQDVAATYQQEDAKLMATNTTKINVEECRFDQDGALSWIRNSMIPLHDVAGEVIGIFGCYEDISAEKQAELERHQAEEQLRQSEKRFRDVSEAAGEYLWDLDENGVYTFVTDKARLVKGYSPEQLLGHSPFEFMVPDDVSMMRQIIQHAIANKQSFRLQHRNITSTGEIVWEEVNGIPLLDAQERVVGFRGTGLSITERKQAEEALRQSEAELRQQTQELEQTLHELQRTQTQLIQSEKMSSLGQLVAGVAHEINNPVNFIHGNLLHAEQYTQDLLELLHLYRQQVPTPPNPIQKREADIDLEFLLQDLPKLLKSMKVGADRIRGIVQSLRTFSRLDEAEFKTVDLHDGIESTLMILQNRLKPKSNIPPIQVVKYYGDLPLVDCYAGQLNQVFMNILANAIDALEESTLTKNPGSFSTPSHLVDDEFACLLPTIIIQTEVINDQWVQISIADNGPGIPLHVQQRLFDPFFTTKQVGKGTGLGMSISYQIVTERHRGSLTCVSIPGHGAEFLIKIPVRQQCAI